MDKKIKQLLKTIKLNESMLSLLFGMVTVVLVGILVFRVYNSNKPEISKQAEETVKPSVTVKVGEVAVETKEDGKKYPTEMPESYKVEAGDHLWKIAEKVYGSGYNWVDIAKENGITNPGLIDVGQELKLPKVAVKEIGTVKAKEQVTTDAKTDESITGNTYKVAKGDHLWKIAVRAYGDGYKWVEIAKANNIAHPNYIEIGQELKLPR